MREIPHYVHRAIIKILTELYINVRSNERMLVIHTEHTIQDTELCSLRDVAYCDKIAF